MSTTSKVKVKTYKGNRRAARGIERMQAEGWVVQSSSTRKMWWRWYCGVFTRSQKHTVTFVYAPEPEEVIA